MPGRFPNMPPASGHASPGPQVVQGTSDRPIPARRRSGPLSSGQEGSLVDHGGPYVGGSRQEEYQNNADRWRHPLPASPMSSAYPTSRPVSTVRPQSAMAVTSPPAYHPERPPSSLGVAWGPRYGGNKPFVDTRQSNQEPRHPPGSTVESKIKSLLVDQTDHNRWTPTGRQEESDTIIPPIHQRSRSHGDGVNASHGYQDGHVVQERPSDVFSRVSRPGEISRGHQLLPGYVPHPGNVQRPSSRQEANGPHQATTDSAQSRPLSRASERPPFAGNDTLEPGKPQLNRGPIGKVPASHDLRSAWQRLYGNRPETITNRRPTVEDVLRAQTPQQNVRVQPPVINIQGNQSRSNLAVNDSSDSALSFHSPRHSYDRPSSALLLSGRESPPGQSSSNPEQVSNNSSQQSSYICNDGQSDNKVHAQQRNLSTFKPKINHQVSGSRTNQSTTNPTIGPAAMYPTTKSTTSTNAAAHVHFQDLRTLQNELSAQRGIATRNQERSRIDSTSPETVEFVVSEAPPPRPLSRHNAHALFDSGDEIDNNYPTLNPVDSIFDYPQVDSENGSVTPPLPSLSPAVSPRGSGHATPTNMSPRHTHIPREHLPKSPPKTPDVLRANKAFPSSRPHGSKKDGRSRHHGAQTQDHKHSGTGHKHAEANRLASLYAAARSRSLDDVRESDNESTLSFDVENTLLTVEPSDQSEMGTLRSSHKSGGSVRAQLHRLEGMYSQVMRTLGDQSATTHPSTRATRRRWSIGSSDTSSFHQHSHSGKHGGHSRGSAHKVSSRDVRTIGKRFQRLESHVITLARSVAHLSSELRSHTSVSREIELVKREMAELKNQSSAPVGMTPNPPRNVMGGNIMMTDFERYRGWVPSLTNPRRVNKLTKFFGQEPPLLEIFLKRLGYERYAKNFEDEHIGMIELPYMTEERLQAIGIPMGPRLRILQEAQLCFKQGNFDVYFV